MSCCFAVCPGWKWTCSTQAQLHQQVFCTLYSTGVKSLALKQGQNNASGTSRRSPSMLWVFCRRQEVVAAIWKTMKPSISMVLVYAISMRTLIGATNPSEIHLLQLGLRWGKMENSWRRWQQLPSLMWFSLWLLWGATDDSWRGMCGVPEQQMSGVNACGLL